MLDKIYKIIQNLFGDKRSKFTKHSFFGAWKNIKKSDEQILTEIGGNWKNFPLRFNSNNIEKK